MSKLTMDGVFSLDQAMLGFKELSDTEGNSVSSNNLTCQGNQHTLNFHDSVDLYQTILKHGIDAQDSMFTAPLPVESIELGEGVPSPLAILCEQKQQAKGR